ncbi:uncharacterized protein LOC142904821 [Nelusetta ayraudi]|uniref:uncharacterized protein LOC142904821 n=1 Tax=Nelusetta ayraudi TaxID=303726 RepID=UPI003F6EED29
MGFTVWLCALCLQASLLLHALDCSAAAAAAAPRVSRKTADAQYGDQAQQKVLSLTEGLISLRPKRQLEHRGATHMSQSHLPGTVSVRGFPNTLIQADRSRRHLAQSASKKKTKRRSRVGSYSLLSNDKKLNQLQVSRARRQLRMEPSKRGNSNRSGAYSVLGDPLIDVQTNTPES